MATGSSDPILFALKRSGAFGARVADTLGLSLSEHEERSFEDGEHKIRPLGNVRNRDVYVIHSLYADGVPAAGQEQLVTTHETVNDKLVRLLILIGALKDASAAQVTAVVPYLAYARKDAKTQPRDPVTTRYIAQMFEAVGTDRVVTLDVHNVAAFQNAFRIRTDHLEATVLFADRFASKLGKESEVIVISPDAGGVKRAERFRQVLARRLATEPGIGVLEKTRAKGVLRTGRLVGDVADRVAIVFDDMIGTGGTLLAAARACKENGAIQVFAAATHGLFTEGAAQVLAAPELETVAVTDSVPPFRLPADLVARKLHIVSVVPLVAEAIRCLHTGGSIVELLQH